LHGIAGRATSFVKPEFLIPRYPSRPDDQCAIVRPLTNRISVILGLRNIFGELSSVRPDHAPNLLKFIQDHYLVLGLKDLRVSDLIKIRARKPQGIALVSRVIAKSRDNSNEPLQRLMGLQGL